MRKVDLCCPERISLISHVKLGKVPVKWDIHRFHRLSICFSVLYPSSKVHEWSQHLHLVLPSLRSAWDEIGPYSPEKGALQLGHESVSRTSRSRLQLVVGIFRLSSAGSLKVLWILSSSQSSGKFFTFDMWHVASQPLAGNLMWSFALKMLISGHSSLQTGIHT